MERFIATQTKTNEALGESINQLNSKFDAMTSHQKATDNQIAQIAQQMSHLSWPQGHLPSQPNTNPRGHVNALSAVREGVEESLVMVLQEVTSVSDFGGIGGGRRKKVWAPLRSLALRLQSAPTSHLYLFPIGWRGLCN